eukprot:7348367-Lingulodinium_polyedra.AAC.1
MVFCIAISPLLVALRELELARGPGMGGLEVSVGFIDDISMYICEIGPSLVLVFECVRIFSTMAGPVLNVNKCVL